MYLSRFGPAIEVRAPAKLNLLLEVLAKRNDGYHEIQSLMVAVSLFDTLRFVADPGGQITLSCKWARGLRAREVLNSSRGHEPALGDLPEGTDNIAVQAAGLLRQHAGIQAGARLSLIKRIPSASGLGGGSSDAAATLVAANEAWNLHWSRERLGQLAAELGSDVPFFLGTPAAICRGRGERIQPVHGLGRLYFVIVRPPNGLLTHEVYQQCRLADRPRRCEPLVVAARCGDTGRLGSLLFNRLQPAAEALSPWIGKLKQQLDRLNCLGHQMTGSGTSYFGMCRHARHARRLAGRLRAWGECGVYCAVSL